MFSSKYKLLMISGIGANALVRGNMGGFYYMLEEFSRYWERIDIICPSISIKSRQSRNDQPFQLFNNVYIHSSNQSKIFQPWFILKKGLELYKKQEFDLFTVHSYPPFYNDIGGRWLGTKLARLSLRDSPPAGEAGKAKPCQFPYILEVMHIAGYPKAGSFKEWFYRILTRYFIKFFAKKAEAVRVINKTQTPEFLKKIGISEKKLKYISSVYIDLEVFRPQELEKKYDMVFSGRLVKNKGINLLLQAVEKLKLRNPNIKLIIVGSGPLKNKIERYIKKHKLDSNVFFSGWLATAEDLAKVYNQSKIFVMPSFSEGGPRTPLEAMACKVPVITSKVGIMLDAIEHGENGLFIDWNSEDIAEKILMLLKDEDLYKKIADNGYKTVQQFERKKAIENYAMTYLRELRKF